MNWKWLMSCIEFLVWLLVIILIVGSKKESGSLGQIRENEAYIVTTDCGEANDRHTANGVAISSGILTALHAVCDDGAKVNGTDSRKLKESAKFDLALLSKSQQKPGSTLCSEPH